MIDRASKHDPWRLSFNEKNRDAFYVHYSREEGRVGVVASKHDLLRRLLQLLHLPLQLFLLLLRSLEGLLQLLDRLVALALPLGRGGRALRQAP